MDLNAKIYIAGHRGLVGSALMRNLRDRGYENFVTRTYAELDVTELGAFFAAETRNLTTSRSAQISDSFISPTA